MTHRDPYRPIDGYRCAMPGCDNRFSLRKASELPVCPECQEVARKAAEADKKRRQRAARQAPAAPA